MHSIAEPTTHIKILLCAGHKLLRYNDKVVQWDPSITRSMDKKDFSLHLNPVTVQVSKLIR
jgi:hypothetical protein